MSYIGITQHYRGLRNVHTYMKYMNSSVDLNTHLLWEMVGIFIDMQISVTTTSEVGVFEFWFIPTSGVFEFWFIPTSGVFEFWFIPTSGVFEFWFIPTSGVFEFWFYTYIYSYI